MDSIPFAQPEDIQPDPSDPMWVQWETRRRIRELGAETALSMAIHDQWEQDYAVESLQERENANAVRRLRANRNAKRKLDAEESGDVRSRVRSSVYTAEDLDKIPPIEWLAPLLLAKDSLAWLYGDPGCYKSFAALDIAASVALGAGIRWAGSPTAQANVLYIAAEGAGGIRKRIRAWETMTGKKIAERITFLTSALHITEEPYLRELLALCEEVKPGLVVIDTQSRVTPGLDENGSVMSTYIDAIAQIRQATKACILTIHHTTKGSDILRGHGSLMGAADTVIYMSRTAGAERYAKIAIKKQKEDRDDLFWNVRLREQHSCGRPEGEEHDSRGCSSLVIASASWSEVISAQHTAYDKVRLMINDLEPQQTITKANIMDATGMPESTVKNALKTLCDQGQLQKTGTGKDTAYLRPATTLEEASASSASFSQQD